MNAVKIAMRVNAENSNNPKDIEYIFISFDSDNIKSYNTEKLYDMLMENSSEKIYVDNSSSYLVPIQATNGKKYIRSTPNSSMTDELMKLPRC